MGMEGNGNVKSHSRSSPVTAYYSVSNRNNISLRWTKNQLLQKNLMIFAMFRQASEDFVKNRGREFFRRVRAHSLCVYQFDATWHCISNENRPIKLT